MGESLLKEDPLSRIQREIIEVTEREREFKEGHFRINRLFSESSLHVQQNGHGDGEAAPRALSRAVSTSHLMGASQPATPAPLAANGYTRRFTPQGGTRGLMQRFIASKGRLPAPAAPSSPTAPPLAFLPPPVLAPPIALDPALVTRSPEGRPLRKGYVPVEEKIQKELREMQDREHELKRMRKKRKPFDLELSDGSLASESEDEELPPAPGRLLAARSIGELYEELRSPSPALTPDAPTSLKPAKSLAELCELEPGQQLLAPSSTRLIAQWESIIQQKQEAGAA